MNNSITFKRIIIIACIITVLLGVLLHFAFDFSGKNVFVGLFTPVNESVWEHLKLVFIPFTLFSIAFYFYTKRKFSNMLLTTVFGNIVGMFLTVSLYYLGIFLFKTHSMTYDIITYIISVMSAYYILYLGIYNKEFLEETTDSTILATCTLTLLFTIFVINTHLPLRLNITKDPITKTYGIPYKL